MDFLQMEENSLKTFLTLPSVSDVDAKMTFPTHIPCKLRVIKSKDEKFLLPSAKDFFESEAWMLPQMQILKDQLTKVKSLLNDFRIDEWHLHTRNMNCLSSVIKEIRQFVTHEFSTIAWCKLFEILSLYQAIPKSVEEAGHQLNEITLGSVHLCEAPGAFIAALNHFLKTKYHKVNWNWLATTLNPYYEGNSRSETLIQDQIILSTLSNWVFLGDDTGNIMCSKNIRNLREEAKTRLKHVHLVTADGSVDCADAPEEQEIITSDLHYCEIMAALSVLDQGGTFLLKMFTFFECNSISKLYLLSCLFEEVAVIKPAMSKEGNSEVYIMCRGFVGQDFFKEERNVLAEFCGRIPKNKSLFAVEAMPGMFLNRVIDCSLYFATCQAQVISRNVNLYTFGPSLYRMMGTTKKLLAEEWFSMTGLVSLPRRNYLLHLEKTKNRYHFLCKTPQQYEGSYNDRLLRTELKHQPGWIHSIMEELHCLCQTVEQTCINVELPRRNTAYLVKYGKPYEHVRCSRFCDDNLLQFAIHTQEFLEFSSLSFQNVSRESSAVFPSLCNCSANSHIDNGKVLNSVDSCTKTLCYNPSVSTFMSSDFELGNQFFQKLCQVVQDLQQSHNLFLCCYPLLTRFNFGFVVLLQELFHDSQILLEHDPSRNVFIQGILLKSFKGLNSAPVLWPALRKMVCDNLNCQGQSQMVVEVLPITTLCKKHTCEKVVQYNNHLLLRILSWKLEISKLLMTSRQAAPDVEMVDVSY